MDFDFYTDEYHDEENRQQINKVEVLHLLEKVTLSPDNVKDIFLVGDRFSLEHYSAFKYNSLVRHATIKRDINQVELFKFLLQKWGKKYKLTLLDCMVSDNFFSFVLEIADGVFVESYEMTAVKFIAAPTLSLQERLELIEDIKSRSVNTSKNTLNLLMKDRYGKPMAKPFELKESLTPFELNYNDDFMPIHELIVDKLNNTHKGIVLLHGKPGCGKTHYIKYLTSAVKRKFIFLPPNMSSVISDSTFIDFLLENKNCVLVIEDAENIILQRETGDNNPAISNILNIADGLLSDILHVQVVCTFNCKVDDIDDAILRSGRLISKYEFKELVRAKADKLAEYLGKKLPEQSASVADIYNADNIQGKRDESKADPIGFASKYII